jgi:uncharacterized protein
VRLVIDTNLMIRALLSPGPAREFFALGPFSHLIVYHSEQLDELREVAARPRLKIAAEAVEEFIRRIEIYGQRVDCDVNVKLDCRDPKDDYLLAVALAGTAEILLTEDEDLLVLHPWRGIQIVRLYQFLQEHPLPARGKP